jgi:outer membrane immunogenic protein
MKTKLVLISAISGALLAAAGSALAADLAYYKASPPPLAAPTWTGFYIGANGGWGWANANATVSPFGPAALADFGTRTIGGNNANGAVFGGQAGYNWQFSPAWVIGIEGDVDGGGAGSAHHLTTASGLAPAGNVGFGSSSKLDYLATVRGRIGYVWGQGLLYFTGGGAWAGINHDGIISTNTAVGTFGQSAIGSWSNTASGYVVGGGYEWMIADHWLARAEYLYYGFGNNNNNRSFAFPVCSGGAACGANVSLGNANISVARFGLSYKF